MNSIQMRKLLVPTLVPPIVAVLLAMAFFFILPIQLFAGSSLFVRNTIICVYEYAWLLFHPFIGKH